MTDISHGRAAYEAYRAASGGRSLVSGDPLPGWDDLRPDIRKAWDAAAIAAVDHVAAKVWPGLTGERDQLRDQLAEIREQLENLAAGMLMSAAATSPGPKSEVEQECAQALRAVARAGNGDSR